MRAPTCLVRADFKRQAVVALFSGVEQLSAPAGWAGLEAEGGGGGGGGAGAGAGAGLPPLLSEEAERRVRQGEEIEWAAERLKELLARPPPPAPAAQQQEPQGRQVQPEPWQFPDLPAFVSGVGAAAQGRTAAALDDTEALAARAGDGGGSDGGSGGAGGPAQPACDSKHSKRQSDGGGGVSREAAGGDPTPPLSEADVERIGRILHGLMPDLGSLVGPGRQQGVSGAGASSSKNGSSSSTDMSE